MNISNNVNKAVTKRCFKLVSINHWKLRLITGSLALLIQPPIDYYVNRKLEPETRKLCSLKSASKIFFGSCVAVLSRYLGEKAGKKLGISQIASTLASVVSFLVLSKAITDFSLDFISKITNLKNKNKPKKNVKEVV